MKGRNLVSLVLSLDADEYEFVRHNILSVHKNEHLVRLLEAIRNSDKYNRKALSRSSGLKEAKVKELLPVLSKSVTLALGHHRPDPPLELDLQLATIWKLVFRIENGPAEELMQDLYDKATDCDRFDILHEILKLAEIMTEPAQIQGLTEREATEKHLNLLKFKELKLQADKLTTTADPGRQELADEIADSELMRGPERAYSVSALAHFYWIQRRISFARTDYSATLVQEKKLIDLLEKNRWLDRYDDFFFAREHRPLIKLLLIEDQVKEAHSQLFKVGGFQPRHPLTEQAKWQQLFPTKIGLALDKGDIDKGMDAVNEFLDLITGKETSFSDQFITINLYYSAYFFFTIGEFEKAQRTFYRLNQFKSQDSFQGSIFPISRILEAFLAYETGDLAEMGRLDKNFRMTTFYKRAKYFKFALGALKEVAGKIDLSSQIEAINAITPRRAEVLADSYSMELNGRFDVCAWMDSKLEGCTMSEINCKRASPTDASAQSWAV